MRLERIDKQLERMPPAKPFEHAVNAKLNRLYDLRDLWEERLAHAELGTPAVYSKGVRP